MCTMKNSAVTKMDQLIEQIGRLSDLLERALESAPIQRAVKATGEVDDSDA